MGFFLFGIERKPDGFVDRFKACLVAKFFIQQHGVDYEEK